MQQHPTYGAACSALGNGVMHFELPASDGNVLASAQVLQRPVPFLGQAALLSRGPVWSGDMPKERRPAELRMLLEHLRRTHRVVAVTPDPCDGQDPLSEGGWLRSMSPCHLGQLDLSAGPVAMRARQHGKWRNRLVRAESSGMTVIDTPMPETPGHWLLVREAKQAKQRRYRRLPAAFTESWVRAGGRRCARLFTAEHDGECVAAMLFLLHGRSATYHIGWSGPQGRALGAHNLLLWKAQLWMAERGIRSLDLDLIDTETTPGLARFKLGSGARIVTLGATRLSAPGTRLFAERPRDRLQLEPVALA